MHRDIISSNKVLSFVTLAYIYFERFLKNISDSSEGVEFADFLRNNDVNLSLV